MLFEQVCKQLNLLETDYFGLEYTDNRGSTYWLDRDKPMNQQVIVQPICSNMLHNIRECIIWPTKVGMPGGVDPVLRFMVKFYMPDPSQLEEEYTRYNLIMLLMKVNTLIMCMKFHYMSDHSQL